MSKTKIVLALAWVFFFTWAPRAIAASDEEQIASIPSEWIVDGYFPEWYTRGDTVYEPWLFTPVPPFWLTDEGRASVGLGPLSTAPDEYVPASFEPGDDIIAYFSPNARGVGVPEPGSLVLLSGAGLCLLAWGWRKRRRR